MFKKLVALLFFSASFYACANAQEVNCKKFRNGTFKMTYEGKKGIIERKGTQQDEYLNGSGTPTFSFTVKWLNDCTYTLEPTALTRKKYPDMPKDATMTVKIVKTTANSYSYTATYNFDRKKVYRAELVLIK